MTPIYEANVNVRDQNATQADEAASLELMTEALADINKQRALQYLLKCPGFEDYPAGYNTGNIMSYNQLVVKLNGGL